MQYPIFLIAFLFSPLGICLAQPSPMNQVEYQGMKVFWTFEGKDIRFQITAPTEGWVAIGFNTRDELKGTNLIMSQVVNDFPVLSDRYILVAGDHRQVQDLGGIAAATLVSGKETPMCTRIELVVPIKASDRFHHELLPGSSIHLLLAYSQEDDFDHHSLMRTSLKIQL